MTLTEFLLARIAEDERVARDAGDGGPVSPGWRSMLTRVWDRDYGPVEGAVDMDSERLLAECKAKRLVVDRFTPVQNGYSELLAILALPYADHPDYREEWSA